MSREAERLRRRKLSGERKQYEKASARPASQAQPQEKTLRYENITSARAEEGILRLLLQDPALIQGCPLPEEEFSSPFLQRLYADLRRRQAEGLSLNPSAVMSSLTEGEAAQLTQILQTQVAPGSAREALADCIRVVHTEYIKRSGDLAAIAELMKSKR